MREQTLVALRSSSWNTIGVSGNHQSWELDYGAGLCPGWWPSSSLTYNPVLLCIEASLPRHEESHPGTGDHAAPVHARIAWLPWAPWPPGWCIPLDPLLLSSVQSSESTGQSLFELPVLVWCGAVFPSLAHLQPQSHVDRTLVLPSVNSVLPGLIFSSMHWG